MAAWEILTLVILIVTTALAALIIALIRSGHRKLDDIHTTTKGIRVKLEDHATGAEHHRRSWSDRWRSFTVQLDMLTKIARQTDKEKAAAQKEKQ